MEDTILKPLTTQSILLYLADDAQTLVYFTQSQLILTNIHNSRKIIYTFENEANQTVNFEKLEFMTLSHVRTSGAGIKQIRILMTMFDDSNYKNLAENNQNMQQNGQENAQNVQLHPKTEDLKSYKLLTLTYNFDDLEADQTVLISNFNLKTQSSSKNHHFVLINFSKIEEFYKTTGGLEFTSHRLYQVDNSNFDQHIYYEVKDDQQRFLSIARINMSGQTEIFFQNNPNRISRHSQSVMTGKIYPVHKQGYLYFVTENRLANSDSGGHFVRCWNMRRRTQCFKSKLKFSEKSTLKITKLDSSHKVLHSSTIDSRVCLGGGINRGMPIVVNPQTRKNMINVEFININGMSFKKTEIKGLQGEVINTMEKTRVKGRDVEYYKDDQAFYYRCNLFVQLNGTSTIIDDSDPKSGTFGDLILVKTLLGEHGYSFQIINHDQKKILYRLPEVQKTAVLKDLGDLGSIKVE